VEKGKTKSTVQTTAKKSIDKEVTRGKRGSKSLVPSRMVGGGEVSQKKNPGGGEGVVCHVRGVRAKEEEKKSMFLRGRFENDLTGEEGLLKIGYLLNLRRNHKRDKTGPRKNLQVSHITLAVPGAKGWRQTNRRR